MKHIPYGRQSINTSDIQAITKSIKNDLITTGSQVHKFEKNLKKYLGSKYVTVCSSGTAALHLAILSINIKPGDVFIIPSINFVSICNILTLHKAHIYLSDVDPLTGQMTPKDLLNCIKKNKIKKIKGFVTMYLGGSPNNNIEFYKIKKKFKCLMIEDACHALGAEYIYKRNFFKVGSCKHSDISVFSLHPLKSITTGEGGIISTSNKYIYNSSIMMRSHGIIRKKPNKNWLYDVKCVGLNYRLSDINCALGISQLKRLNQFIKKRRSIVIEYFKKIKTSDKIYIPDQYNKLSAWHLFKLNINFKKLNINKDILLNRFLKKKISLQQHYIPIYKFQIYKKLKLRNENFLGAESYYKNSISFPIFYDLKNKQQDKIINLINQIESKK